MRRRPNKEVVFAALGLGAVLALQAFMVCGPISLISVSIADDRLSNLSSISCQLSFAVSFFAIAAFAYMKPELFRRPPLALTIISLTLGFFSINVSSSLAEPAPFLVLSGVLFGIGQTLSFVCCTRIYASFNLRLAEALIIVTSIFPIVPYFLITSLGQSTESVVKIVEFVLFPLAAILLVVSLKLVKIKPLYDVEKEHRRTVYGKVIDSIKYPVIFTFLLGLVSPVIGNAAFDTGIPYFTRGLIFQVGNTCAAVLALLMWFGFRKRITVTGIYFTSFPILATVLLLVPFVDSSGYAFFLALSDMIFCLISIAVIVMCLEVARARTVNIFFIYGVIGGAMYLSRVVGLGLGGFASALGASYQLSLTITALLLLYCFSVTAFLAMRGGLGNREDAAFLANRAPVNRGGTMQGLGRDNASTGRGLNPARTPAATLESECVILSKKYDLSKRESDILLLIVKGRNVPAISEILSISENTVRTHIKNLYHDMGVHSRQELLDMVDEAMRSDGTSL